MVEVAVSHATKVYNGPHGVKALFDVSITAVDGEFLVLLGPSGSGKTTLLRAIAGLESLDAGDIFIGDRCVTRVDPGARNIGMVFQDYALYPHMTVRGNIAYNMRLRGVAKAEMQRRTNEVAAMLRLELLLDRRPAELSGGQRQRVALGRAITRDSAVLLMDEPLSNLDAQIREHVRVELRELQRRIGVTTIYVTLDQVEAMVIADRIAVMSNARIEQVGSPETIYDRPQTLFCARFVGSPQANEVRGVLRWTGEKHSISLSRQRTARLGCASSSTPTRLICRANRRKISSPCSGQRMSSSAPTGLGSRSLFFSSRTVERRNLPSSSCRRRCDTRSRPPISGSRSTAASTACRTRSSPDAFISSTKQPEFALQRAEDGRR